MVQPPSCLRGYPTYPDPGRFWQIVDKYKVSIFYTAPTAIRALISAGPDYPLHYNLESLRVLGTVGEPDHPEAWMWYYEVIGKGRCPIMDTWWQTETGGIMITPLPGSHPIKPGCADETLLWHRTGDSSIRWFLLQPKRRGEFMY